MIEKSILFMMMIKAFDINILKYGINIYEHNPKFIYI